MQAVTDEYFRECGNSIGLYSFFIPQKTDPSPRKPWSSTRKLFQAYAKREHLRLSFISPGVFGAIFRDGGMDAVKKTLNHTNFLRPHPKKPRKVKLYELGLTVCQILFLNSIHSIMDQSMYLILLLFH